MGTVIREIEGKKHVPAHAHEAGAIEHDGDWWRPLPGEAPATPDPFDDFLLYTCGKTAKQLDNE